MPSFGQRSTVNLSTCHPDLQKLFNEVVKKYDCSVLCGYRGRAEQNMAYSEGKSQVKFPKGKHNIVPSMAADVVPYPIQWENIERFCHFAGYVQRVADDMGISVTWGGSWETFKDYPHWEIN